VEACLLGIVFVNIDLPELAASTNLDDARAGVDKPLFTFSVAFLDDSVEIVYRVRLILNRQGSAPLIGGRTFLQCEVGVFLAGPRSCQQSAIHCPLLQSTIQGQLPGSERLGRTQKFLGPAESDSEQQPSTFMYECFSHAESRSATRFIFDLDGGLGVEMCAA